MATAQRALGFPVSRSEYETGKSLSQGDRYRVLMRQAIDLSGWKLTAVAAALDVEPTYLSRLLSGEKRWTFELLEKLPDDIERIFARLSAESFGGIVVENARDRLTLELLMSFSRVAAAAGLPTPGAAATVKAGLK